MCLIIMVGRQVAVRDSLVPWSHPSLLSCLGLVLSIQAFDPECGFRYASAVGPIASNSSDEEYKVLRVDTEREGAGFVAKPFSAARESWEGWEFQDMQQYLEALNRSHPEAEDNPDVEDGPEFKMRMIVTDTVTGRSELMSEFATAFEVDVHDDGSFTCTGHWRTLVCPRWGGRAVEVRVKFGVEPCGPQVNDDGEEVPASERMYQVRSIGDWWRESIQLELQLPERDGDLGAHLQALLA
jgi:hypothetical protein